MQNIFISESGIKAKDREVLENAGLLTTENAAIYCFYNNGFQKIKGIGPKKEQEIEAMLTREGWKCRPDNYDRLYFDAYGKPEDEGERFGFYERSPETDQLFEDALEALTDREQAVLRHYYGIGRERLNLGAIAKSLNCSGERVKQIFAKALRKLRHPSRRNIFKNIRYSWMSLSDLYDEYCRENQRLKEENRRLRKVIEKHNISIERNVIGSITIDDLELSVRTYNCLYRVGIREVEDLAKMERGEIFKIRNLGRRGLEEVVEKLKEKGVEITI